VISLNALNPVVLGLIIAAGLIQPIWYPWLGYALWQGASPPAPAATARPR
jgi:hypothetical protein